MRDISKKDKNDTALKQKFLEQSLQHMTEEFAHKIRELSLIKSISDALIDAADQRKVCLEITRIILNEFNAEYCSLMLVNEKTHNLEVKAAKRQVDNEGIYYENDAPALCRIDEGLAEIIIHSGSQIYIEDVKDDKRFTGDPLCTESSGSVLCLPLISGNKAIGALKLSAPETNAFVKEDRSLMQIVANHIANVLRNVQLVNNLKEAYTEQEKVLNKLKKAEKTLSNYVKDLEIMVEKRTNELVQSEKLASVGRLVAGIAHEINNPLTIVMGFIDLLADSKDMPKQFISRLEKVHDAAIRCTKIVNNLLKFSQKEPIERKNVDINSIIKVTLKLFDYQFKAHNIKLRKNLQKALPMTVGDSQQLQQVFLNFVSNAFDALSQRKDNKILEVKTRTEGDHIVIEYRDTGPGIKKEHQQKLFEPFFTTKDIGKGTGLGLSLSYGIIKEHEGNVFLDASYTKGAKFVIHLPIIEKSTKLIQTES